MASPLPESAILIPLFQLEGASLLVLGAVLIVAGMGLRKLKVWGWWLALIGGAVSTGWALYGIAFESLLRNGLSNTSINWGIWFLIAAPLPIVIDLLARRKLFGSVLRISRPHLAFLAAFAVAPLAIFQVGYSAYAPMLEDFAHAVDRVKNTSPEFISPQEGKVYPLSSKVQPIFSCSNPPTKEYLGIELASCEAAVSHLDTSSAGQGSYKIVAVDSLENKFEYSVHYSISDSYNGYFVGHVDFMTTDVTGLVGRENPVADGLFAVLGADEQDDIRSSEMVWSQNGERLILLTESPENPNQSSIWMVDIDTGEIEEVKVPLTISHLVQLRLSPDEKYLLATIGGEGGDTRLIKISTMDGELENIADTTEFGDFMPDGSIVYVQQTGEEGALWLVEPSDEGKVFDEEKRATFYGRNDTLLYEGAFPSLLTNDFVSNDGSKMAFVGEDEHGQKFLTTFDTKDRIFSSIPISIEERSVYPLKDMSNLNYFDWNPNGNYVMATVHINGIPWDQLVVVSADDNADLATLDTVLESWDGKYTEIHLAAISPDGRLIAFVSSGSAGDMGIYIAELNESIL